MDHVELTAVWWSRLGADTQDWLAEHLDRDLPLDVTDQIEAAGGHVSCPPAASSSASVGQRLAETDRVWIRTNFDAWAQ